MSLNIGAVLFEQMDQLDFTGAFEVLSRLPDSVFHIIEKSGKPIRDTQGLILTPDRSFENVPQLDVLIVPGGTGINTLMEDEETLNFLRQQAPGLKVLFPVCTGTLVCGAAGLLQGRAVTTHWASHHLLKEFGAQAIKQRVVVDGNIISASGVTSSIDGALTVAAHLCGTEVAQKIQLYLEYTPVPPFSSGSPEAAPAHITAALLADLSQVMAERERIVRRVGARLRN